jgi:hypothetical protein
VLASNANPDCAMCLPLPVEAPPGWHMHTGMRSGKFAPSVRTSVQRPCGEGLGSGEGVRTGSGRGDGSGPGSGSGSGRRPGSLGSGLGIGRGSG